MAEGPLAAAKSAGPARRRDSPQVEPQRVEVRGLSLAGFHRLNVWKWEGRGDGVPIVCVHGLTRQGRDFDPLARRLARAGRTVFCPDLPGRGLSEWLRDPACYNLLQYGADMNAVLARLGAEQVDWVGTSLGGLVGMMLAAQPGHPIRRLVLNDIGPYIPSTALRRLGRYIGSDERRFVSLEAAETRFRDVLGPFGNLSNAEWRHLTLHSLKSLADGGFELHHDPAISQAFRQWQFMSVDLWRTWDAVDCPVLVLRGAQSDFLSTATVERMQRSGAHVRSVEFAGCGHAPSLLRDEQVGVVSTFLQPP
jgi:pimeloyl-ACP methyl ester carboxylesterase